MFGRFRKKKETPPPLEPELLLEEVNPHGTLQAVVESHGAVLVMYLVGLDETDFGIRSLWLRNLGPAPAELDVQAMKRGEPPLNPAQYCTDEGCLAVPESSSLRFVWLPESNGVALYEADKIIGIIPPWSGHEGFCGYSDAAVGTGPLAWGLDDDNQLFDRFRDAEAFWAEWERDDRWSDVQDDLLDGYESILGTHAKYYAIDGDAWPPKALVRIPGGDCEILLTLGMSVCPQPNVESETDDYKPLRRIELGAVLPSSWDEVSIEDFCSYMSGLSTYPWLRFTWLGAGHTTSCDAWRNQRYSSSLLWPAHPAVPNLQLNPQFGDPARVLWILPITGMERRLHRKGGGKKLFNSLPEDRWQSA